MIAKLSPGFYLCVTDKDFSEKGFKTEISNITKCQILTMNDIDKVKLGFNDWSKTDHLKCIQVTNMDDFYKVTNIFKEIPAKDMDCSILVICDFDMLNKSLWIYKNMYTSNSPYKKIYKIHSETNRLIILLSSINIERIRHIDNPIPFEVLFLTSSPISLSSFLSKRKYYTKLIDENNNIVDILFIKAYCLRDATNKACFESIGKDFHRIETQRLRDRDFISR